ncbi:globin domain-containing protein [Terrarubrum flagellatum]|uniref:globin domain-containing protein n=1 Tax=Terrirubrum flagellatum TaxID=2895980 RepID=UPI0031454CA6
MTASPASPEEIELIRQTFAKALAARASAERFFYDELFRIAPELRPMFRGDIAAQGAKLIDTLALAVYALRSPAGPAAVLAPLGRAHARRHGVTSDHFEPVGQALIATLERCLGPQFDGEAKLAWLNFYRFMTAVMIEAASEKDG